MPCGGDGGDPDDDDYQPKWWNRIEPEVKPDDPNSFMALMGDFLGDTIDGVSDLITKALVLFGGLPVLLLLKLTDHNIVGGCAIDPNEE